MTNESSARVLTSHLARDGGTGPRRTTLILICAAILSAFLPLVAKSSSHSSHPSTTTSASKTEHVHGYTTKNGKYVAPYSRQSPGMPHKPNHVASGYSANPFATYDKHGKIKRSGAAKDSYKREQPCPAKGHSSGNCPGYVIDHVRPLECGGTDAPSNMQWQTVADGKAKDKTERYCR
jgi:hypothetical protein